MQASERAMLNRTNQPNENENEGEDLVAELNKDGGDLMHLEGAGDLDQE